MPEFLVRLSGLSFFLRFLSVFHPLSISRKRSSLDVFVCKR